MTQDNSYVISAFLSANSESPYNFIETKFMWHIHSSHGKKQAVGQNQLKD